MTVPSQPVIIVAIVALIIPACHHDEEHAHHEHSKIVVTSPAVEDVVITQQYVCQIHSQRHIEVCALESGYLLAIPVREGQAVMQGDVMFKILPTLYQAKLDAEQAEARLAQIQYDNAERLQQQKIVSDQEVALKRAELDKALAKANLAAAELNFADIRAPFDGIVDRLQEQQGSLVDEGDVLTTLSDNSQMWVYFNVPEARYLEYVSSLNRARKDNPQSGHAGNMLRNKAKVDDEDDDDDEDEDDDDEDDEDEDDEDEDDEDDEDGFQHIELILANGKKYPHAGRIAAIEAKFNNETGNIPFRADFPNPNRLLRHGQTGTVLIHRKLNDAVVIPQRATFEILDKLYVWVVGEDHTIHQRPITVAYELEDIFVVKSGLKSGDKIVLEGIQHVHENDQIEYEYLKPVDALKQQKHHAE